MGTSVRGAVSCAAAFCEFPGGAVQRGCGENPDDGYIRGTRLYGTAEELRERMELYRFSGYREELKRRFDMRRDAVAAFGMEIPADKWAQLKERHRQIEERITELHERYTGFKGGGGFFVRRVLNAYPNIKTHAQALKDRRKNKAVEE